MTITALLLSKEDIQNSTIIFEKYSNLIPRYRHDRIISTKNEHSRAVTIYAGLLMSYIIHSDTGMNLNDISVYLNTFGKPELRDNSDYHFSLSHSNNLIVFAGSSTPVGIDTEYIRNYNQKIAAKYFHNNEYNYLESLDSNEQNFEFTRLWTMKEAYLKMTGSGLSTPLSSFCVTDKLQNAYIENHTLHNYIVTLCSRINDRSDIVFINIPDIINTLSDIQFPII